MLIITEDIINQYRDEGTFCEEGAHYALTNGYVGLKRHECIEKLSQQAKGKIIPHDYYLLVSRVFYSPEFVLKFSTTEPTGRFKCRNNIDHESLESALASSSQYINDRKQQEVNSPHLVSRNYLAENTYTQEDLDMDSIEAPIATCYAVFDANTGEYTEYDNYEEARQSALTLRTARHNIIENSAFLLQELLDLNSTPDNPIKIWKFYGTYPNLVNGN
jgi:hypothetical protein